MEPIRSQSTAGDVVLTRTDGAVIVYDGDLEDGTPVGHIVSADGQPHNVGTIVNISKFNIWNPPAPGETRRMPAVPREKWLG